MDKLRKATSRAAASPRLTGILVLSSFLVACGGGSEGSTQRAASGDRAQASSILATAAQTNAANELRVVELAKLSEVRVSRTVFDYTFQVRVRNTGSASYENVHLTLTSVGPGSSIVDGVATLNRIAGNAEAITNDSVTIRQDRIQAFDLSNIKWQIEATAASSPQEQLAALESSGAIPTLERGTTLAGSDTDGNGVRDDIEAYISAQYSGISQRAAAMQAAKALQAALLVNVQDAIATKDVSRKITYAANCIFDRFLGASASRNPARVMRELEGITANTKPRLLAYLAYNKALDGTSSALPEGDTCE